MTKITRNAVFAAIETRKDFVVSPKCKEAKILRQFEDEGLIRITTIANDSPYEDGLWRIEKTWR